MCPSCNSTDIRKLAVIYNEGISHGTVKVSGTFSTGYAVHQTGLSRLAAPPKKWSYSKPIALWILVYILLTIALGHFMPLGSLRTMPILNAVAASLFGVPIIGIAVLVFRYNRSTYQQKLSVWRNRFMCQRCGTIFSA